MGADPGAVATVVGLAVAGATTVLCGRPPGRARALRDVAVRRRAVAGTRIERLGTRAGARSFPWRGCQRDECAGGLAEAITAAAAQLRAGADARTVVTGLDDAGHGPGDEPAVGVALALASRTGAPLADVLDRLADATVARDAANGRRVAAEAGPSATVRVLTWLPGVGLVMSTALGLDPARLVAGGAETMCVAAGVGLALAGRAWARGLVRAAVRAGST